MLHLTEETTVKEILDACSISMEDLVDFCNSDGEVIDTDGELLSEVDSSSFEDVDSSSFKDKDVIDTAGFGIIDGGKKAGLDSKINKVAKLFARKLRKL